MLRRSMLITDRAGQLTVCQTGAAKNANRDGSDCAYVTSLRLS